MLADATTAAVDRKHELNIPSLLHHIPFAICFLWLDISVHILHSIVRSFSSGKCGKTHSLQSLSVRILSFYMWFFYHTHTRTRWRMKSAYFVCKIEVTFFLSLSLSLALSFHPPVQSNDNECDWLPNRIAVSWTKLNGNPREISTVYICMCAHVLFFSWWIDILVFFLFLSDCLMLISFTFTFDCEFHL